VLEGPGACGTPLFYDHLLLEAIPPVAGETCALVRRLTEPPSRLYVRVNTLRVDPGEYLDMLRGAGLPFHADEEIPEALWAPVEGPLSFPLFEKRVVADKRAAESVLMGSDLYAPGVVEARGVEPGDRVTVVAPNGVPVGSGVAVASWRRLKPLVDEARRRGARVRLGLFVRVEWPMFRAPRVRELPGYDEGLVYGQSLPSMYVARLLDPKPGEVIVDATAAPGGKVSHAAQLAGPASTVVAVDRPSKVGRLRGELARLGMDWVRVVAGDSRRLHRLLPELEGRVDKLILDPPCTNLGVIPKVADRKTHGDSASLARYQASLARAAARMLKPGGVLSYSVCTLTATEAEAQTVALAEKLGLEPIEAPGWARRPTRTPYGLRFSPLTHGVTGFFIALLRKPV